VIDVYVMPTLLGFTRLSVAHSLTESDPAVIARSYIARCCLASNNAPSVSSPWIVRPSAESASSSGISTTLMSKYFSISVSSCAGPASTTGVARKKCVEVQGGQTGSCVGGLRSGHARRLPGDRLWRAGTDPTLTTRLGIRLTHHGAALTRLGLPRELVVLRRRRQTPLRRIWCLAVLAFFLMLCEGVANDWSALAMRDAFGVPTGRLLTDGVVGRLGPVMVLRFGACIAAVTLTGVVLAPTQAVALTGWTLFGLGLSGCIPQLFSAAGHFEISPARTTPAP